MVWFWYDGMDAQQIPQAPPGGWEAFSTTLGKDLDYSAGTRTGIKLRSPEWIEDLTKPTTVSVKRSMSGVVRSYVAYDRKFGMAYTFMLHFKGIRLERKMALEHFLACSEGRVLGYKTPSHQWTLCLLTQESVDFKSDGRAAGLNNEGELVEDETCSFSLEVRVIKTFGQVPVAVNEI